MEQDFIFQAPAVDIQFIRMVQETGTLFYQTEQGLTQQVLIQEGNFTLMRMVSYTNLMLTKRESMSRDPMLERM